MQSQRVALLYQLFIRSIGLRIQKTHVTDNALLYRCIPILQIPANRLPEEQFVAQLRIHKSCAQFGIGFTPRKARIVLGHGCKALRIRRAEYGFRLGEKLPADKEEQSAQKRELQPWFFYHCCLSPPVTEPNLKVAHQRFNRLFRQHFAGPFPRTHVKEADDLVIRRTPQGLNHMRVCRIAACAPDTPKAECISR